MVMLVLLFMLSKKETLALQVIGNAMAPIVQPWS